MTRMSKTFDKKFDLVTEANGDVLLIEPREFNTLYPEGTFNPKTVWTTYDTGATAVIAPGLGFVNRMYYVFTEQEWDESDEVGYYW